MANPDEKLTSALTEIKENDASIDTFTDFPTRDAIDLQIFDRMLYETMELDYYDHEADFIAEVMRSWDRQSRKEIALSLYKDINMFNRMVNPYGMNESTPARKMD